jgi:hypothetical protein
MSISLRKPLHLVMRAAATVAWAVGALVTVFSLLVTALVGWAWWHASTVFQDRIEVLRHGQLTELVSDRDGLSLHVIRRWPWSGAGHLRAESLYTSTQYEAYAFHPAAERTLFSMADSMEIRSGRRQTFLELEQFDMPSDEADPYNLPVRISYAHPTAAEELLQNGYRWSMALPFFEVRNAPHGLVMTIAALPAVLCIGFRGALLIRRWTRRRRAAAAVEGGGVPSC